MGRIWFDALTSKQFLIAVSLKEYLGSRGYDVIITSRSYDAIEGLRKSLGVDAHIIGSHGSTPYEKLRSEIHRMISLLETLSGYLDEVVAGICYPNPAEARIVYGLGKPLIVLSDTPHSVHPHRLSLPLASYFVYSSCIDDREWSPYLLPHVRVIRYDGVDELSWIKHLERIHDKRYIKDLGLSEKEYIVLRPEESKASYYTWSSKEETWFEIIEKALGLGIKIVYLPRYQDQRRIVENRYRGQIERGHLVIPPPNRAIGPALAKHSIAVISGGGTMAREAALYGVPGVSLFPLELSVDRCLASRGLPIYRAESPREAIDIVARALRDPGEHAEKALNIVRTMKAPQEVIVDILDEI